MNKPDLSSYRRIVFFIGGGVSAESGVPTYRGKGGVWSPYNYEEACQKVNRKRVLYIFHQPSLRPSGGNPFFAET